MCPPLFLVEVLGAKDKQDRASTDLYVRIIDKPVVVKPFQDLLPLGDIAMLGQEIFFNHVLGGLIFVTDGKLKSGPLEICDQVLCVAVYFAVVSKLLGPIPIDDDTINPGQFH